MKIKRQNGDKLLTLEEAIKKYVSPGMKLHLSGGIGGPSAAICEIIRQYYKTRPGFELIQSTIAGHSINLIQCNLVKKMIFSACIEISTSGRPSKVIQKAFTDKCVEFENWSLLTLQQRLMAGALGIGFMPTRSLCGSSIASENPDSFCEIGDPFDSNIKTGIVRSLNPDLSIVHGCASDEHGNTILSAPYGDDIWGSLASLNGVIVTVDKVVSDKTIKRHSSLVKIPSYLVKAVCLAPLGAHPFSFANPSLEGFEPYLTDEEFLKELQKASSEAETLNKWIEYWITGCKSHDDYIEKLGKKRISELKKLSKMHTKQRTHKIKPGRQDEKYSIDEITMIAASREITESIIKSGHKTMLVGAGSKAISARLAYQNLRDKGYDIELITGNGQVCFTPLPGESSLQSIAGIYSARMLTDTITSQGVIIGGRNSKCLSVLGAGQIDKFGNINSSRTSKGDFLIGTGGANDAANANEVIVILNQTHDRFVENLPYITARGDMVGKVISTMGIFKKDYGNNELILSACFTDIEGSSLEDIIKKVRENCAWHLKIAEDISQLSRPTKDELQLLRYLLAN